MKSVKEFLSDLRGVKVRVWADGDRLRLSAPTGALTPELRAELAARKAEVLQFLHAAGAALSSAEPRIQPVPRDEDLPLSFAQERLWFLDQLEGKSPAYNIPAVLRLDGPLEVVALGDSLKEILRRHEVLRTTFPLVDGHAAQAIASTPALPLPVVDLRNLSEPEQATEVRRLADEEAQRPFDLAADPLLRTTLLQLDAEAHVLLLTMHHIVSDGWSLGVFLRELGVIYGAFSRGEPSPLPDLPVQYADFAVWQRKWLAGGELERQLSYWKRRLAGAPPLLKLPTDRARPPVQGFLGDGQSFEIGSDLARRLKALSEESGTTLFMTLLAAFVVLLTRYSGQKEIVVGSPIAGRNLRETESLIGFFVNTLVWRTEVSGETTFRSLLGQVRQTALEAFAHQDLPFERLVAELRPERSLSYSPLFQVMFIMQNAPMGKLEIPGMRRAALEMEVKVVRCDLTLSVEEAEDGLKGLWTYKPDLFDAATIARLSQRYRVLLESITRTPGAPVSELQLDEEIALPQLPLPAGETARAPLSYHQERLWFIDQFETGSVYESSPCYHNLPLMLHLEGAVESHLLERSLNAVVARHEALRTRIVSQGDQVFQAVSPDQGLKLKVIDLAGETEGSSAGRVLELALDEVRQPFVLLRDPLVRATLYRISAAESLLALAVHHIVADKRSLRVIAQEVAEVYDALVAGRPPQLSQPPHQYPQFVKWERGLPEKLWEPYLFYWKYRLGGRLPALELPVDRPRPPIHTFTDARRDFSLGEGLARRIKQLSRQENTSELAVLLAGFKLLLHRYARQDEIVVGVSEPGRDRSGLEQAVGPFANLLVLRSSLAGDPTFGAFLAQVSSTLNQARRHGALPFDLLVRELNPEKDMSRTALFDVLFEFDDQPPIDLALGGARARMIETNLGAGKYDLNLSLRAAGAGLAGTAVYNADLFDGFMIEQMLRHYEVILEAATSDPGRRIEDFALLSEAEERQQIFTWNLTQASYPADKTISQLFEEQAERTPEEIAVVCGDEQLTYGELDARANRLAHHLREQGVAPETLVALCLDRSPEMIIALLGVLKAGGAYLPLDPTHPEGRLRFMVTDAGVKHLITTEALARRVGEEVPAITLLDTDQEAIGARPATPPACGATPQTLAYCIYTSGSTGQPKGVLLEHRHVVRLMINDKLPFAFSGSDVWTMFHSYCFDFSVWEMYGALLYGGKLVIVPAEATKDPALFLDLLARHRVTVLNLTPTAFYELAREELRGPQPELALRYVIFGGEALRPAQLAGWRRAHPRVRLINMYGITETTVHVTFKELGETEIRGNLGNIGRPIPTTTTYLMNPHLRLLPVGVPGEICVGGHGVGRGYLGRDDLTRQKFVPNPYRPGERLYRSGDLAKLLPSGEMIYLGRIDDQVQIRGFRVELEEIRNRLAQHPAVAEAVVVARQGNSGAAEIVAYIVAHASGRAHGERPGGDPDGSPARRYELPDGSEIFHLNKNETDFLYQEIFEEASYLKHGVTLEDGDCVFDVGANIGLFTLFAGQVCKDVAIYAFEPIPAAFEALRRNAELYDLNVKLFACGLGKETKQETFTYYPHVTIFSGRFAAPEEEQQIIRSFLLHQQERGPRASALAGEEIDELLAERFTAEQLVCPMRSLSDVIREEDVKQIDLLKIDVEKSELDLLAGIEPGHWPKIQQIVMEVHNVDQRLETIRALIESHGFEVTTEQDEWFADTSNYNLYAVRPNLERRPPPPPGARPRVAPRPTRGSESRLIQEVRAYLKEVLPDYMMPSAVVPLARVPRTSNGKVDYQALPAPEQARSQSGGALVAPRTPVEQKIAAIWREVLGLEQIGIQDNFFEVGGHSLLATQVISRLRDAFALSLPVRTMFESPTIAGLAEAIEKSAGEKPASAAPALVPLPREAKRARLSSLGIERR